MGTDGSSPPVASQRPLVNGKDCTASEHAVKVEKRRTIHLRIPARVAWSCPLLTHSRTVAGFAYTQLLSDLRQRHPAVVRVAHRFLVLTPTNLSAIRASRGPIALMGITREDVLTVNDVAALLELRPYTVKEYAHLRILPGRKLGRTWRFLPAPNLKKRFSAYRTPRCADCLSSDLRCDGSADPLDQRPAARAPVVVYRGCRERSATALTDAMRSSYELVRKPHPADLRATVLHMAVSMFDDGDRASSTRSTSHSRVWAAQIRLAAVGFEALLRSHDEGGARGRPHTAMARPTDDDAQRPGRPKPAQLELSAQRGLSNRPVKGNASGPRLLSCVVPD